MAPSPGGRPGTKRTDATKGVDNLTVEFYRRDNEPISGLGELMLKKGREREEEKWADIGRQIAADMGRRNRQARERKTREEVDCHVIGGDEKRTREAVRSRCVVEKMEEERVKETRRRKTEEERKERRSKAAKSRRARRERRRELMAECAKVYEEWLWEGLTNDLLRHVELKEALRDLTREYMGKIRKEEVRKEKRVMAIEVNEFFNSSIRETNEIVDRLNKKNGYLDELRKEMASIMRDVSDKGAISVLIDQSTVPETRVRRIQTGIRSGLQGMRERGKDLESKGRDMKERRKLRSGEQDEKKGRKEQRRRELLLLWEAPPVGPPVGDEEEFFLFFSFLFFLIILSDF